MDVILLKDVEKLGAEGTVVRVKPGFARNYLVPSGLAVPASPQRLAAIETATQRRLKQAARVQAEAERLKQQLERRSLTLKLAVGADDAPFGSVTVHDVAEALARDGMPVAKPAIHLEHPIKTLGVFDIPVRLHPNVTAMLKLWVVKA